VNDRGESYETGGIIAQEGFYAGIWHNRWLRIAIQLILVVGFSALTAAAKRIHPSLGIPGSSGILWLTAMVTGRLVTRWDGAGFLTGMGTAVWGIPIGLEHTFVYDLALYGCAGLLIDIIARLPKIDIRHPVGAMLCGFGAHMAKYGFIVAAALSSSVTKHFLLVGLLNSALLHAAFGIAAGLVAWGVVKGAQSGLKGCGKSLQRH
jgi:hypothetical protein